VLTQYGDAEIVRGESLVAVVCPHILLRGLNPAEESHSMVDTKEIPR
jgi:hypothetical protein